MQSDQAFNNMIILISLAALAVILIVLVIVINIKRMRNKDKDSEPERPFERTKKPAATHPTKHEGLKPLNNMTIYHILQNGKLKVNNILFNLNYMIDEVVGFIGSKYHKPNVEIVFDLDMDVPIMLMGSPSRLAQVLINLLEFTLKETDEGVIELKIKLLKKDNATCSLHFTVIDTGAGVDQTHLDTLFTDPGEDGDPSELSMYVSHALIASEGGQLRANSEAGRGTQFGFNLKFKLPESTHAFAYPVPSSYFGNVKVAIVETRAETARILKALLGQYNDNITVLRPKDLGNSINQFAGYGMVLIDKAILQSDMVLDIKQSQSTHDLKIIALENIFLPFGDEKRFIAVDYNIAKPFTPERIIEMLTIFYGEQEIQQVEEAKESAEATTTHQPAGKAVKGLESFLNDSEIPVMKQITKENFTKFLGAKVLIVEDNLINQKVIMGLLGDSGISLSLAENGVEALEVLEKDAPFDLILMDINMPVLDGFEATRRIRANPRFTEMPVVAFTGLNLPEQIVTMQEVGMNAQMAKPLNVGKLFYIFSQFLPEAPAGELSGH